VVRRRRGLGLSSYTGEAEVEEREGISKCSIPTPSLNSPSTLPFSSYISKGEEEREKEPDTYYTGSGGFWKAIRISEHDHHTRAQQSKSEKRTTCSASPVPPLSSSPQILLAH